MATTIQDGTGTKLKLKVTNKNRALVQSVTITEEDNAITTGQGYQIASGPVTFTAATETGILYIKNNDERDFVLDRAVLVLGSAIGAAADQDWTFTVLRNPTEGTTITNELAAGVSNSNHGSANVPSTTNYKGLEGYTLTNGSGAGQPIKQTIDRIILPLGRRLPKGSSIGFRITPPTGVTLTKALVVTHWWYDESDTQNN
tara:strand:+ start:832 stop:1434 length:603 start_codon:yes stop_codon:yes gene_type:complete